jgi:hypothetical protein
MQPASQRRRDLETIAEIHQVHDDGFSKASRCALLSLGSLCPNVFITFPSQKKPKLLTKK